MIIDVFHGSGSSAREVHDADLVPGAMQSNRGMFKISVSRHVRGEQNLSHVEIAIDIHRSAVGYGNAFHVQGVGVQLAAGCDELRVRQVHVAGNGSVALQNARYPAARAQGNGAPRHRAHRACTAVLDDLGAARQRLHRALGGSADQLRAAVQHRSDDAGAAVLEILRAARHDLHQTGAAGPDDLFAALHRLDHAAGGHAAHGVDRLAAAVQRSDYARAAAHDFLVAAAGYEIDDSQAAGNFLVAAVGDEGCDSRAAVDCLMAESINAAISVCFSCDLCGGTHAARRYDLPASGNHIGVARAARQDGLRAAGIDQVRAPASAARRYDLRTPYGVALAFCARRDCLRCVIVNGARVAVGSRQQRLRAVVHIDAGTAATLDDLCAGIRVD